MDIQQWVDKHYKRKASDKNYSHIRLGQALCSLVCRYSEEDYNELNDNFSALFYSKIETESLFCFMKWLETKPDNYFENITEGM